MQKKMIPGALLVACATVFFTRPTALSETDTTQGFDRAQTLVINLNKKVGSSGFYLLEGLRYCETMDHDILKALRQVQEVERTYAKLRGKPDNRYFELTEVKIDKAMSSNAALRDDLRDAYSQLKAQIKDTLVMDEVSAKKGLH
ncbi:MAG TPA: hypothetical protein V6C97_25115 [Oculatellaceae cyanobacterium]